MLWKYIPQKDTNMDGKNKIIQRILADAETKCQDILAKAHADTQDAVDKAQQNAKEQQSACEDKCTIDGKSIVANALSNAKLDINKYKLSSKQGMIDQVYNKVSSELHSLPAKQYLALITKLIETHAEEGETVTICQKDKDVVTASFLSKFDKGLSLDKNYGNFDGGVVLSSAKYDKVLTLDRIVEDIRRTSDSQVAKILFGE